MIADGTDVNDGKQNPTNDTPRGGARKKPKRRRFVGSKKKKTRRSQTQSDLAALEQEITITLDDEIETLSPTDTDLDSLYGGGGTNTGYSRSGRELKNSLRIAETIQCVMVDDVGQADRDRLRHSKRRRENTAHTPPIVSTPQTAPERDLASTTVDDFVFYECEESIV